MSELGVDCFVIATDVSAVFLDWGTPQQREIRKIAPQELARHAFAAGSMGPEAQAASAFVLATGRRAVTGSLDKIEDMLAGKAGTQGQCRRPRRLRSGHAKAPSRSSAWSCVWSPSSAT